MLNVDCIIPPSRHLLDSHVVHLVALLTIYLRHFCQTQHVVQRSPALVQGGVNCRQITWKDVFNGCGVL